MEKSQIREEMLARRRLISQASGTLAAQRAAALCQRLLKGQMRVLFYMPFRGELCTRPLMQWLADQGGELILPVSNKEDHSLSLVHVQDVDTCRPGAYGILEPPPGAEIAPASLDAVIVPGIAFDYAGYRVGYGGGYYDRFLPRLRPDCLTIGYAYDWQLLPRLKPDPWDSPLSHIVTDRRCLRVAPV